ncbi:MAG: hypothetical protein D6B25_07565 [Desulfobulbaceae bacterium]|nr:MAG: hypothetical protein D6B25_07565 [Desulfobulbaceae bacterium]
MKSFSPIPLPVLMAIAFCLALGACSENQEQAALTKLTGLIIPDALDYQIEKNSSRKGKQRSFQTIRAVNNQGMLKCEIIKPVDPEEAARITAERLNIITSLYNNLPSPYPGMVTNAVEYPVELRPKYQTLNFGNQQAPLFLIASSKRYTYGALPQDQIVHKGFVTFIYNPAEQSLVRLDYFLPAAEFVEETVLSLAQSIIVDDSPEPISLIPSNESRLQPTNYLKPELAPTETAEPAGAYNVILVGFEPLGSNHVGSYGYPVGTTPNLDQFGEQNFLFENALSPSSWTLPVFMTWFTSLYPSQHGITNKYSEITNDSQKLSKLDELSPQVTTLAQILKRHGYTTAGFTGGAGVSSKFGYDLGFDTYFDEIDFAGFDETMPRALKWLQEHHQNRFFLFIQGFDVHGRFPLDQKQAERFLKKDYSGPLTGSPEEYWDLRSSNIDNGTVSLSDEDFAFLRSVYDAKIAAADARFGAFIDQLESMKLMDDTIIVISSGSGNEYNQHGRIDHGFSLYQELIQVPLLIHIPGLKGRTNQLVRTLDIAPTVLDALNITDEISMKQFEGVSLIPLMQGESIELIGFSETDYLLQSFKRAVNTSDGWKLILSLDTEARELYNLQSDPLEQTNLIEQNGRKAYELEQMLYQHLSEMSQFNNK